MAENVLFVYSLRLVAVGGCLIALGAILAFVPGMQASELLQVIITALLITGFITVFAFGSIRFWMSVRRSGGR